MKFSWTSYAGRLRLADATNSPFLRFTGAWTLAMRTNGGEGYLYYASASNKLAVTGAVLTWTLPGCSAMTSAFAAGWHAVACVVRPTATGFTAELWVDGVLADSETSTSALPTLAALTSLDIGSDGGGTFLNGYIDDLLAVPAALTSEAITGLVTPAIGLLPAHAITGDVVGAGETMSAVIEVQDATITSAQNGTAWDPALHVATIRIVEK